MRICWGMSRKHRNGYLLAESMISLLVCVFAIWTITTMLAYVGRASNNQMINFYSYIDLLESDHFNFRVVKVSNNDVILYSPNTKKKYHMQQYKNMLRFTGDHLGHVPTLVNVGRVYWDKEEGRLSTDVKFENGEHYQAYSKLQSDRQ